MFGKLNLPALSVVADLLYWLTGFWMVTVAFGTTAPVESVTVPVMLPALPVDCAKPAALSSNATAAVDRHCSQMVVRGFAGVRVPANLPGENDFAPSSNEKLPDISTSKSC